VKVQNNETRYVVKNNSKMVRFFQSKCRSKKVIGFNDKKEKW